MEAIALDFARQISDTIRCLISEWGSEHFKILLPRDWALCGQATVMRSDFQYSTDTSIIVVVGSGSNIFCREFKLPLPGFPPNQGHTKGSVQLLD